MTYSAEPFVDLTGLAITDIRDAPAVAALVAGRVRGGEKAPANKVTPGDVVPYVVVVRLATPMFGRRSGLQQPLFGARCYGATRPQAAQVAAAVAGHLDGRRNRAPDAQGRYIIASHVENAGADDVDPDTDLPYCLVTFTLLGAAQAVAP